MLVETFDEPGYSNWHFPFGCEIHFCFPKRIPDKNNFSVLVLSTEPPQHRLSSIEVKKIAPLFNLILTFDQELLSLPNAVKLLYGDTWITSEVKKKEYSTSFLYSRGMGTNLEGYGFRKEVWLHKDRIVTPICFWTSVAGSRQPNLVDLNPYPHSTKDPLFNSMFSIIIENCRFHNYFSEKIIDAIRTYTVPIYFGCPNIGDFFDPKGIIQISSVTDLIEKVNLLRPNDYWNKITYMSDNFSKSESLIRFSDRLKSQIESCYSQHKFI